MASRGETQLRRDEVLARLGGYGQFERFHRTQVDERRVSKVIGADPD
jgi:hypothetical protein